MMSCKPYQATYVTKEEIDQLQIHRQRIVCGLKAVSRCVDAVEQHCPKIIH